MPASTFSKYSPTTSIHSLSSTGSCRPHSTRAGCLILGGLGAVPDMTARRPAFCEMYQLKPPCRLPGRMKLSIQRSSTASKASLRYDQCFSW